MIRVGFGYDVHKLVENRNLILGGVQIPFEKGLLGHSDADCLLHAIMDSILGAMSKGDIGKHFPDNDDKFKDISSLELLDCVKEIMDQNNFELGNLDSVIIMQRPKVAGYIDQMCENIAKHLQVPLDKISVKATTEEGLGFTGNGEGVACQAICSLYCKL